MRCQPGYSGNNALEGRSNEKSSQPPPDLPHGCVKAICVRKVGRLQNSKKVLDKEVPQTEYKSAWGGKTNRD